jgi:serine/threonine-protein kinase RsbW
MMSTRVTEYGMEAAVSKKSIAYVREAFYEAIKGWGYSEVTVSSMDISMVEWIENILKYGNVGSGKKIRIKLKLDANRIAITIEDAGTPFNPLRYKIPDVTKRVREGKSGKMGIKTIRTMCDRVLYKREKNCNILTLIKNEKAWV